MVRYRYARLATRHSAPNICLSPTILDRIVNACTALHDGRRLHRDSGENTLEKISVAAASPSGVIPVTEHDCFIHFNERLLDHRLRQPILMKRYPNADPN